MEGWSHDVRDVDDLARAVLLRLTGEPGVRRAGVALVEGGGRRLRFTSSDRPAEWCHIDAYEDVPLTSVVRTGEPILAELGELEARFAGFVRAQPREVVAVAAAPLLRGRTALGGIVLFCDDAEAMVRVRSLLLSVADSAAETVASLRRPRRPRPVATTPHDGRRRDAGVVVEGDPSAVSVARRFLRERLADWQVDSEVAEDAVLCLSELVTNVVIHAGTAAEIHADFADDVLRVVVRDTGGTPFEGSPRPDEPLQVHGRGLQVVEALATRWSTELDEHGRIVWFELADVSA